MQCPICGREVALDAPQSPFCSERCRLIDLGKWAAEEYRIAGAEAPHADSGGEEEPG